MSTRSMLLLHLGEGVYRQKYIHHDGYLAGVGATLAHHYDTADKVEALFNAIGEGASILGDTPEETAKTDYKGKEHQRVRLDPVSWTDYLLHSSGAEYFYIFQGGQWFFAVNTYRVIGQPGWNSETETVLTPLYPLAPVVQRLDTEPDYSDWLNKHINDRDPLAGSPFDWLVQRRLFSKITALTARGTDEQAGPLVWTKRQADEFYKEDEA